MNKARKVKNDLCTDGIVSLPAEDQGSSQLQRQIVAGCWVLAFLALFFLSRLPFLSNTLVDEEGIFAALVADSIEPSSQSDQHFPQQLMAKVDGSRFYNPIERNIVPYLLIERGPGTVLRKLGVPAMAPKEKTEWIRAAFFVLFLIGTLPMVVSLCWSASLSKRGLLGIALMAFGLTTPLVVGASIQPQLDGSVGAMLLGLAAFFLLSARSSRILPIVQFGVAGVLVGLGRPEWPMAFGGATLVVLCLCLLFRIRGWRLCCASAAGIALGVTLSFFISPSNFAGGFGVMARFYGMHQDPLIFWHEIRFLWPVVALLAAVLLIISARLRFWLGVNPGVVIVGVAAAAITVGFAVSAWAGDGFPRYYSPALILSCFALATLILRDKSLESRRVVWPLIILVCVGFGWDLFDLGRAKLDNVTITSVPGVPLSAVQARMASIAGQAAATNGIAFIDASIWVYYPQISFVEQSVGWDDAKQYLAARGPGLSERLIRP